MNRTGWMSYAETQGVKMVELPYLNRVDHIKELANGEMDITVEQYDDLDISMYLLMGEGKVTNPEKLLKTAQFDSQYVKLSLPKFQVEYQADLIPIFKQFGMKKTMDLENAEFEPMFNQGTMGLDAAVHKTYIKVDEKGTEAAAVTFLGMAGSCLLYTSRCV